MEVFSHKIKEDGASFNHMTYIKYKNPWTAADTVPPAAALNWIETGIDTLTTQADATLAITQALTNKILTGNGSPEGVVIASVGTIFLRLNGLPGATLYAKETGSGNTGWRVR